MIIQFQPAHYPVSLGELLAKKETTNHLYITSCAVILENYMLFLGNSHEQCLHRAQECWQQILAYQEGYFASDGKFYDSREAWMIAYRNRQTPSLCTPLKAEDIF